MRYKIFLSILTLSLLTIASLSIGQQKGDIEVRSDGNFYGWNGQQWCQLSNCGTIGLVSGVNDVTIETYGLQGRGRPKDPSSYYFLQAEGIDLAKIKVANQNTGGSISLEREGNYVYFYLTGTNKYLKFTNNRNQVKWLSGKDNHAKWKEIPPIQPNAGGNWKSYVLSTDEKLFLRHTHYIIYAHPRQENKVFYGDATWRIGGGMLVPPNNTVNPKAYGKKEMQTYARVNQPTNSFFCGHMSNGKLGIIDKSNPRTGRIFNLEVRYKKSLNTAVLVDEETGNYITTDSKGNISLNNYESEGAYWNVTPAMQSGLDDTWFSLESRMKPGYYLRHTGYVLYAHKPGTVAAQYFKGDASWKLVDRN